MREKVPAGSPTPSRDLNRLPGPESAGGGTLAVVLALAAVYVIWGSTYLAIRFAVQGIPPFLMGGVRFLIAGTLLFVFLRLRGAPMPTVRQWAASGIVGALLVLGGNGGVAFAEQKVASGVAALMIATTPLWAALWGRFWGRWPTRVEIVGLAVGFAGMILLNVGGSLRASPLYAVILLGAAAAWALGSVWSPYLRQPAGMMASAAQQFTGGAFLLLAGIARGEHVPAHVSRPSLLALLYLIFIGSVVAFTAYSYLLRRVRPTLATSYAYVNPVVAVGLGVLLAGERVSLLEIVALVVILTGVILVIMGRVRRLR